MRKQGMQKPLLARRALKEVSMRYFTRPRFRPTLERLEDRTTPSASEVWVLDQSNTFDDDGLGLQPGGPTDSGGTLYVYQGDDLAGADASSAVPEVIDLGGAARDLS